jgi:hypothetical protein
MSPIPTNIPYGKNSVMLDELLDEYEMSGEKRVLFSLKELHKNMKKKFPTVFKYVLTHRLNQDCMGNFFSQIRTT